MRFEQIDKFLNISKVIIGVSPTIQNVDEYDFFFFRFIFFERENVKSFLKVLMGFFHGISCQALFPRLYKVIYGFNNRLTLGKMKGQDFIKIIIVILVIIGVLLATLGYGEWFISLFEEV